MKKAGLQEEYQPTEYEDSSYEIIGTVSQEHHFIPLEAPVVKALAIERDEMFRDFGGLEKIGNTRRWNLPSAVAKERQKRLDEPKEVIPTITMTVAEYEAKLAAIEKVAREEAHESAKIEATAKMQQASEQLLTFYEELERRVLKELKEIERQAVILSSKIATRLVRQVVEINPDYLLEIIKEGLGIAQSSNILKIRVSEEDFEFLQFYGIANQLKGKDDFWEFVADVNVKSGCIIETRSGGEIDFSLEKALAKVEEQLFKITK
jgi:flagellar biosynthesis/type III secretory pathway protein FliH